MEYTIWFDLDGCELTVAENEGSKLTTLALDENCCRKGEIAAALKIAVEGKDIFGKEASAVVVLPDRAVYVEYITMPNLGRRAMSDALRVSVEKMYKNHRELEIATKLFCSDKRSCTYQVTAVRKNVLQQVREVLNGFGVSTKLTCSSAGATASILCNAQPQLKNGNNIILSIGKSSSEIILVGDGAVLGVGHIPVGEAALSDTETVDAAAIIQHDAAKAAIRRAESIAKFGRESLEAYSDGNGAAEKNQRLNGMNAEDCVMANFRFFDKQIQWFCECSPALEKTQLPVGVSVVATDKYSCIEEKQNGCEGLVFKYKMLKAEAKQLKSEKVNKEKTISF